MEPFGLPRGPGAGLVRGREPGGLPFKLLSPPFVRPLSAYIATARIGSEKKRKKFKRINHLRKEYHTDVLVALSS